MFNKERMKGILTGVVATSIISVTMLTVFAAPVEKAINVVYDTYRIIIDGADKSDAPEDSKPFIFNGRTYVPLRYIAESMGKQVKWDGDTTTIYINDEGNSREDVYFATQGYDKSDNGIKLDGNAKTMGLYSTVNSGASNDYSQDDKGFIRRGIIFNLNGIAKNVYGTIDMSNTEKDYTEGKVVFYDQNNSIIYESTYLRNSTNPIPFEFSALGVLQLKVEFICATDASIPQSFSLELKEFRYSK